MPVIKLNTNETFTASNNFGYSAAKLDHLACVGGAEFTLVTVYSDVSSSVAPFRVEMEQCLRNAITELQSWAGKAGKENAIMLRWVTFASEVIEQHGFRLLSECNADSYDLEVGGMTHCFEAVIKGNSATGDYARRLAQADWMVNALSIAITDGDEQPGDGAFPMGDVKSSLDELKQRQENLESHVGILVGVNTRGNEHVKSYLARFETEAGWDHMRSIENATADGLTDLTQLIVSSVSSQSQGVGSGGASVRI